MESQKTARFEATISLDELKRLVIIGKLNPLETFEKYPIQEVRDVCLKKIRDYDWSDYSWNYSGRGISPAWADWAEQCVKELLQQEDPLWKDILALYVQNTKHKNSSWNQDPENWTPVVRSIEFALSLVNLEERLLGSEFSTIAKFVTGKIKDCPVAYEHVPSMKNFIEKLLFNCILKNPDGTLHYIAKYREADWYNIIRALSIIVKCQNFSFIPAIEELVVLIRNGELKPSEHEFAPDIATAESHLAILTGTISILKRQHHDILYEENHEKVAEQMEKNED
ncbi:MAG: hypothetical protein UT37_C0015G0003 [Parcubacteria group bacterium GW2011_GWA2_39_18]|nr:MAG: hypothetical protein UT37_C0015G0003 [Parcubacteria group bacterium GW2011_GWA2_39_18]